MRFLQTEWHRHERDRNAWDIERAEMKSRIGNKQKDAGIAREAREDLGERFEEGAGEGEVDGSW